MAELMISEMKKEKTKNMKTNTWTDVHMTKCQKKNIYSEINMFKALHLAARKGDNDLVKLFIESGTRVDTQNVSKSSSFVFESS